MLTTVLLLLIVVILIILWLGYNQSKKIKELSVKTGFAAEAENLMKIEFDYNGELGKIADNFNTIGNKFAAQKDQLGHLENIKSKHHELSGLVDVFESSISQITLITDIGKDITSSLGLEEILSKVYKYIVSSMAAGEVHFMIENQGKRLYYVLHHQSVEIVTNSQWTADNDNVLNWSFNNNKELVLNHAEKDYGQYVFKPIHLFDQSRAASVIGIPFGFNTKQTGSMAVYGVKNNAFDTYHLDFVKSLASYIAVAIDNSNLFEELDEEKEKSDGLLLNILPEEVANELKRQGHIEPKQYNNVTVLFTDMVNFTGISETMSPTQLVQEIHRNFTAFDAIIERNGLEKIKTIGDAYLAVCGMPNEVVDHAQRVTRAALEILHYMKTHKGKFEIRIGINTGPLVAGIVGVKKYAYDIWGDTVNTAARMEQNSEAGKINISGATFSLIRNEFACMHRGKIAAKNKGEIDMYFVQGMHGGEVAQ
ncbi:MAG: adenylate/guanylate cyclase domain-containing protein [Bacteroidia bacterium]|jgi:class 3 adenylate cyclase